MSKDDGKHGLKSGDKVYFFHNHLREIIKARVATIDECIRILNIRPEFCNPEKQVYALYEYKGEEKIFIFSGGCYFSEYLGSVYTDLKKIQEIVNNHYNNEIMRHEKTIRELNDCIQSNKDIRNKACQLQP